MVVAGQRLGNVEATHTAKLLFLLKEEELVGLHVELTTYLAVVVDDDVVDAEGVQLLAASQSGRTSTNDSHLSLIHFHLARRLRAYLGHLALSAIDAADFLHAVDFGDADAAHLSVDKHLAGPALANAAIQASVAAIQAMAVNGVAGLV